MAANDGYLFAEYLYKINSYHECISLENLATKEFAPALVTLGNWIATPSPVTDWYDADDGELTDYGYKQLNASKVISYYQKAAEQKFVLGLNFLGEAYKNGKGVAKDKTKAFQYLLAVFKQGDDSAFDKIIYAKPHQEFAQEVRQSLIAAESGDQIACRHLKRLGRLLLNNVPYSLTIDVLRLIQLLGAKDSWIRENLEKLKSKKLNQEESYKLAMATEDPDPLIKLLNAHADEKSQLLFSTFIIQDLKSKSPLIAQQTKALLATAKKNNDRLELWYWLGCYAKAQTNAPDKDTLVADAL